MQFHDQTSWTIDKHLAYGIWFAAIAAGYTCSKLISWFPGANRQLAAACCVVALVYPAAIELAVGLGALSRMAQRERIHHGF